MGLSLLLTWTVIVFIWAQRGTLNPKTGHADKAFRSARAGALMLREGEFAAKYNVSRKHVADLVKVGLLKPVRRNNHVLYGTRSELRIVLIQKAERLGFSLKEIKHLIDWVEQQTGKRGH